MADDYEKSSGNVFADLGFADPERELVLARLTVETCRLLKKKGMSRTEAAKLLGISQASASALMRYRPVPLSIERLREFLALAEGVEGCQRKKR
jgi:predicted XRE-type DNA-binding protein